MTPEEAKAQVLAFTRRPLAAVVAVDEDPGARLVEAGSLKELRLAWDEVERVEERRSPQRVAPYLAIALRDGRQLALADVGFAFAPVTANTGPLPDLPPTVCFRDFRHMAEGIARLFEEEGREREILSAILFCIALLDGARATGFEVSREERTLDGLLAKLELRGIKL